MANVPILSPLKTKDWCFKGLWYGNIGQKWVNEICNLWYYTDTTNIFNLLLGTRFYADLLPKRNLSKTELSLGLSCFTVCSLLDREVLKYSINYEKPNKHGKGRKRNMLHVKQYSWCDNIVAACFKSVLYSVQILTKS